MANNGLEADERAIIAGRCNGQSNQQVAATLRYSEGMVANLLSRALRRYVERTSADAVGPRSRLPYTCYRLGYVAGRRAASEK